jgi:hypothetical protein
MLATHWAVHNSFICSLGYRSCRTDRYGAVDDRQSWPKTLNVSCRLTDKILDLKRVADVQDVDLLNSLDRRDIYPNSVMVIGKELKERLPDLSESDDNNLILLSHGFGPPSSQSERFTINWKSSKQVQRSLRGILEVML